MQAWLNRMYAEHGAWYVRLCAAIATAEVMLAMTPIATLVTARYEGLTLAQWAVSIAVASPLAIMCLAIAGLGSRKQMRLVNRWASGDRDGLDPHEVAAATHALPRRLFFTAAPIAFVTAQPVGVITTLSQVDRLTWADFAVLDVGGFFFALWGIVLLWVWGELSVRPVLVDIASHHPDIDVRTSAPWTVTMKLSVALGSAFLVGACYGGSLSAPPGSAFNGLWKLIGITMAVSIGFGLLLVPPFSAVLLEPIRDLTRATRDVGSGDLSTHVPVINRDEVGELEASFNEMVTGLRERSSLRAHNASLVVELQASRERLVAAGDAARRQVERDLHDGAQQQLTMARLKLRLLHSSLSPEVAQRLDDVEQDLDSALRELRELAHGVYPIQLDTDGLPGAVRYAVARCPLPCDFTCATDERYRAELEIAMYFSCVEALQNAAKHAGPDARVRVELHEDGSELVLEVRDDGAGFVTGQTSPHAGLQNIVDRIGAVGGEVVIRSDIGHGTTVTARTPITR